MTRLAVLTPSFAGDFELCAELNRSVLAYTTGAVDHHIVVPRRDLGLFGRLAGPRTHVVAESDFLPAAFRRVPGVNYTVNLRRPYPPVRGWILQQVVKLAAAARVPADVVVLVDSDIVFRRPFGVETFVRDGTVRLYRKPDEIDQRLPRHVRWHRVARALLGLPPAPMPHPDYVSSLVAWDPAVVRAMQARIAEVTGRPWAEAVAAQLHVSEWTLYGVFVDEVLGAPANGYASDDPLCHCYWDEVPLDRASLDALLAGARPTDIAVMVSAKSRTPLAVRRRAFAQYAPQLEPPSTR